MIKPKHMAFEFRKSVQKYPSYEPNLFLTVIFKVSGETGSRFKTKGRWPYSALNSNYWRLNFENGSIGFRAMREQHTDIHTYTHTHIQTYIHTYRQTDGTKLLYRLSNDSNKKLAPDLSLSKWVNWLFG